MDSTDTSSQDDRPVTENDSACREEPGATADSREPMPDGGECATACLVPENAGVVSRFIDEYRAAPGFELTYREAGEERVRTVHDISLVEETVDSDAVDPILECIPVAPDRERFTVQVPNVERLRVVRPPAEEYTAGARTAAEEATGFRRLAEADPSAIKISSLLGLPAPGEASKDCHRELLRALRLVANERPDELAPVVPLLEEYLAAETSVQVADALAALQAIGDADPGAIVPLTDVIVPFLHSNDEQARTEATGCVVAIARDSPEDLVETVPTLAMLVEQDPDCRENALFALARITSESPGSVKPFVGTLRAVVLDESLPDAERLNATVAFGNCVGKYPETGVDAVADIADLLGTDNRRLRNNAVAFLADVAAVHTDVVADHAAEVGDLLTADDDYLRMNASCVVARVAEDFPDAVNHLVPTLVELLDDDEAVVRKNACWALGYLEAGDARDPLQGLTGADVDREVRRTAAWALDRLGRGS